MFKTQIQDADLRKAHSHVLCKRRDGGYIGGVDQIDGEPTDVVHAGNHIGTLIFIKRLGQYLMDCSAAIDREEHRKDTNMVGVWGKTLAFQCNDNWKE